MKLVIALLSILLIGCAGAKKERPQMQVLESSTESSGEPSKTLVHSDKRDVDRVTNNGVVTQVAYRLKDRAALKAHSNQVCLLSGFLPPEFRYQEVGKITATKRTYGEVDEILGGMADEARRIGVDAILGVNADQKFRGPTPRRMYSPVGEGLLVKFDTGSSPLDCEKAGGKLR